MDNNSRQVIVCSDLGDVSRRAAAHFVEYANHCVQERGCFTVCLSGGSTPRQTYGLLAEDDFRDRVPWQSTHVFWGDERMVALNNPDNHFRMASDIFINKVPIPPANVHRARVELGDAQRAAGDYENVLRAFFDLGPGSLPRFDLILLGMGADGHMASLFPRTEALGVTDRLVAANFVPKLKAERLTLTLPVLNHAREVMFLVSGSSKAEALGVVLQADGNQPKVPAQLLNPKNGSVIWMVDKDAAAQLQSSKTNRPSEALPQ